MEYVDPKLRQTVSSTVDRPVDITVARCTFAGEMYYSFLNLLPLTGKGLGEAGDQHCWDATVEFKEDGIYILRHGCAKRWAPPQRGYCGAVVVRAAPGDHRRGCVGTLPASPLHLGRLPH